MKKVIAVVLAVFIFFAFTCALSAATAKKVGVDNPDNAKQGVMPDDKAKVKDNQTKVKTDKITNANTGKKVQKKDVQQEE